MHSAENCSTEWSVQCCLWDCVLRITRVYLCRPSIKLRFSLKHCRNMQKEIFTHPFHILYSAGDVMGVTTNHLHQLLSLPYGCGEQNMIHFAPNVYVLHYLNNTNQMSDEVTEKALNYLQQGTTSKILY